MNEAILGEGGTVLPYVGDAVLAVFGAPGDLPAHAEHALRAAAGMCRAQERRAHRRSDGGGPSAPARAARRSA